MNLSTYCFWSIIMLHAFLGAKAISLVILTGVNGVGMEIFVTIFAYGVILVIAVVVDLGVHRRVHFVFYIQCLKSLSP